jgi:hypothetical protein
LLLISLPRHVSDFVSLLQFERERNEKEEKSIVGVKSLLPIDSYSVNYWQKTIK